MPLKKNILPQSSTMAERLNRLHSVFHNDDRVLIVINADPDAIAGSLALKRLLWRRVALVTIARTNVVKRHDNLAMIRLLKVPLVHINDVQCGDFTRIAIVDSQPHHQENLAVLKFDVIIDHHPLGNNEAPFQDVRPDYGATSTIMTEYLRAAKIRPSQNLATALFYGIKTDTNNFVRQGMLEDMRAFRFLFPLINQNVVNKIENSEYARSTLKYFQEALDKVKIGKDTASVFLGRVTTPDTLVIMADFFMRVHDINRSIAFGIFKDHLVIVLRVVGHRKNAGRMVSEAFGLFGAAGGHKAMARAEIPLSNLDPTLFEKEGALERFITRRIQRHSQPVKTKAGATESS
ncbi:MAG: DHH family phosphoesterase [Thermodesulfobacteriota bacterium]|nr:DHH family phosphoesterase [Thermodesulfobacteriota bacterium]